MRIQNGVDVFLADPKSIVDDSKVGLITNPTGVTTELYSTFDAFYDHPNIDLVAVFGPERARQKLQGGHRHFDLLMSTDKIRKALSEGVSVDSIMEEWKDSLELFMERRKNYILYE